MWCGIVGVVFLLFASVGCKPEETLAGDMCVLPEPPDPPKENIAGGGPTPRNQENCEQLPAGVPEMPINEQKPPTQPVGGDIGVQPTPEQVRPEGVPTGSSVSFPMPEPERAPEQVLPEGELMGDVAIPEDPEEAALREREEMIRELKERIQNRPQERLAGDIVIHTESGD
jgi:hypothetical protein